MAGWIRESISGQEAHMYVPPLFKEESLPVLHDAIRQSRLATLVTLGTDGMEASHVPMLLDPEPAPFGTLHGHIARSNPQWQRAAADGHALAIFLGPDAYVSPSWYATKQTTGKVVPTWNYVAIHAYGPVRFFDDADRLLALVTKLTETHEGRRAAPWAVTDAPEDYIRGQLKHIIGFEIPMVRLEGKWKMSQNRPAVDRAGVVEGLVREGGPQESAVAGIVAAVNKDQGSVTT
jgi:transcriptional regulator